jgi:hypothetical protein
MTSSYAESDEALARRLQAQEMGNFTQHGNMDVQTPLMVHSTIPGIAIARQ